nr:MAG TPA: hypothetical protein [Caudoviricetes sp.]DAZ16801.1 MAG TPA: hypothetical protein [Caudoviricetes sp.]
MTHIGQLYLELSPFPSQLLCELFRIALIFFKNRGILHIEVRTVSS